MLEMPRRYHRPTWSNALCRKRDLIFWKNWWKMFRTSMWMKCKRPETIIKYQSAIQQCHIPNIHRYPLRVVNRRLAAHQSQLGQYHHSTVVIRRCQCEMVIKEVDQWHQRQQPRLRQSQNPNCLSKHKVWTNHFLRVCRLPQRITHQISTPKSQKIRSPHQLKSIQWSISLRKFKTT